MITRTVLLGMNAPTGTEPLGLFSPNGAGRRLLLLSGMTEADYEETFERRNVLDARGWLMRRARRAAGRVRSELAGRTVVVLGLQAWAALGLPRTPPYRLREENDTRWFLIPHPSGRNLYYNDPGNRRRARRFLQGFRERRET